MAVEIRLQPDPLQANVDGRTAYYLFRHRNQVLKSSSDEEVGITAVVSDLSSWESLKGIHQVSKIPLNNEETLVTARVSASKIENISHLPYVTQLKVARPLFLEKLNDKKATSTSTTSSSSDRSPSLTEIPSKL